MCNGGAYELTQRADEGGGGGILPKMFWKVMPTGWGEEAPLLVAVLLASPQQAGGTVSGPYPLIAATSFFGESIP